MRRVYYRSIPYVIEDITRALEAGVDGLIVPDHKVAAARSLARCAVFAESDVDRIALGGKADEERAAELVRAARGRSAAGPGEPLSELSRLVVLAGGWEIIPLENLLASSPGIAVEVGCLEEAELARGVLEHGVEAMVILREALPDLKAIIAAVKNESGAVSLTPAVITRISHAGMGHRVCVDTTTRMRAGQGMLVGNSASFTFLVNAETEPNEYVASRPFRVNAGGVHSYALMPEDRTAYLDELRAGSEVLIVDYTGAAFQAVVGRVKVERRPMLMVEAEIVRSGKESVSSGGAVFLQNAETIRLVTPEGKSVSVAALKEGDTVLCRTDTAGRHFGIRISEDIKEG
ncbi:MAG: 3-dehydroquinate synthase II family protein [Desulfovibrio sp.]|jgi:3-dehydroquinate synthase II|nr:3-dehydroquinate synthase II family protein [Desulfovibrio sp.]